MAARREDVEYIAAMLATSGEQARALLENKDPNQVRAEIERLGAHLSALLRADVRRRIKRAWRLANDETAVLQMIRREAAEARRQGCAPARKRQRTRREG